MDRLGLPLQRLAWNTGRDGLLTNCLVSGERGRSAAQALPPCDQQGCGHTAGEARPEPPGCWNCRGKGLDRKLGRPALPLLGLLGAGGETELRATLARQVGQMAGRAERWAGRPPPELLPE